MHPNHMLQAMVGDRRRQVIFEAGVFRHSGPAWTSALLGRIVRLVRRLAVPRHARSGQTGPGPLPAVGPRA